MATGVYSTIRPATVDISDVEIFYTFSPSRESIGVGSVNRLNPNDVLVAVKHPDSQNQILGGLYSLKLPAINFSQRGFTHSRRADNADHCAFGDRERNIRQNSPIGDISKTHVFKLQQLGKYKGRGADVGFSRGLGVFFVVHDGR